MPSIEHGYERGISMVVEALIVAVLIGEIVPRLIETGLLPPGLFSGIIVVSIVSIVMTIGASRYWSFGYLSGFVIGVFLALPILSQTDFIGLADWVLYGGAAVGAVALRIKIRSSGF